MALEQKTYTIEEYLKIALLPENDLKRLELVNGQIIEMAPSSTLAAVTAANIMGAMGNAAHEGDLGYVVNTNAAFELSENTVRMPDGSFIAGKPELTDSLTFPYPPTIAVEIVSPGDSADWLRYKIIDYLQHGVKLVLEVYPKHRLVYAHRSLKQIRCLTENDILDGSDVLPGFKVLVRDMFPK